MQELILFSQISIPVMDLSQTRARIQYNKRWVVPWLLAPPGNLTRRFRAETPLANWLFQKFSTPLEK
jgi:hypothetical protein